jgi:hypothetical protein
MLKHFCTSVAGVEYLELYVEGMSYQHVITPGTEAFTLSLGALKAFVLEFPLNHGTARTPGVMFDMLSEPKQALVLSGPENLTSLEAIDPNQTMHQPLLSLTMQCTQNTSIQDHPPLLIFSVREVWILKKLCTVTNSPPLLTPVHPVHSQFLPDHIIKPVFLKSILILQPHLCLSLLSLSKRLTAKILYAFYVSPI